MRAGSCTLGQSQAEFNNRNPVGDAGSSLGLDEDLKTLVSQ